MPQEEGGWASLFSPPMVLRGWGAGLGPHIQFPGLWPRSSVSCQAQISHSVFVCTAQSSSGTVFHSATQPLGTHSSNHPQGEPATAQEFLTKQLPTILNKRTAFHTAQLSNQSRDYQTQGPKQPKSSLLQVLPGTSISLVPVSTVPADVYRPMCFPLRLYSPQQLPASRSLLVLGCPPCSGRGGSWLSNSPPHTLWQAPGQRLQQPRSLSRSQGSYHPSANSSLSVFQCPLQFLASKRHISWDTVGHSLCSSEDQLGVPAGYRENWALLPPTLPPSSGSK